MELCRGGDSAASKNTATPNRRAKAVGIALKDLDALGDWIESELHDQRDLTKTAVKNDPSEPRSAASTPDSSNGYENYRPPPDVTVVQDEHRVIRRGKRRFAKNPPASRSNRFSAPNLAVTVEDLVGSDGEEHDRIPEEVVRERLSINQSIYSSVQDLSEGRPQTSESGEMGAAGGQRDVALSDDFVYYTPPRKCVPCKDPNILEALQSKVGALKRIGSKVG